MFLKNPRSLKMNLCFLVFLIAFVGEGFSYILSHKLRMSKRCYTKRITSKCRHCKGKCYTHEKILDLHFHDYSSPEIFHSSGRFLTLQIIWGLTVDSKKQIIMCESVKCLLKASNLKDLLRIWLLGISSVFSLAKTEYVQRQQNCSKAGFDSI